MDVFSRTILSRPRARRHLLPRPRILVFLLVGLMLFSSLGFIAGLAHSPAAPAPASNHLQPAIGPTHGDLVVGPSNSPYLIQPTTSYQTYYQGGNITVLSGGTLIVRNTTIDMVQFVTDVGTPAQRLSHVYTFSDAGTVWFYNSQLTTDTTILNAYTKLSLTVTGTFSLWRSLFEFPGWIAVSGSTAVFDLNQSQVLPNPLVPSMVQSATITGDTEFAPDLTVSGGAQVLLVQSNYTGTYKDNTLVNGYPGPTPLNWTGSVVIPTVGSVGFAPLTTSTNSQSLVQDWLNPVVYSGSVQFIYNATLSTTAPVTVTYNGTGYPLAAATFVSSSGTMFTSTPLSAALITAINKEGILSWLNHTGNFGTPTAISISAGPAGAAGVHVYGAGITLLPSTSEDLVATGAGSSATAVDSKVDVNWNLVPSSPVSQVTPYPWLSNKFMFESGAVGVFANVSVLNPYTQTFFQQSAFVPDGTSKATFYRWAVVPVTGAGASPVPNAHVTVYYAYSSAQTNNATANALNNLPVAAPALNTYANYFAGLHGVPAYGTSNGAGAAFLLLASAQLNGSNQPDGNFLGTYHFGITVPVPGAGATQWFNGSVTPYPYGMAPASPDVTQVTNYPGYIPKLAFSSVALSVNGVAITNSTVAIGEKLRVNVTVQDTGTAPVTSLSGTLYYLHSPPFAPSVVATAGPTYLNLLPTQTTVVSFTWVVNESVTGAHGFVAANLQASIIYNGGVAPVGGTVSGNVPLTVAPAFITLRYSPATGNLDLSAGSDITTSGTVSFAGNGSAIVNVSAIAGNGNVYVIGQAFPKSGSFLLYWTLAQNGNAVGLSNLPSGTYSVRVTAYYNDRTVYQNITNAFTIPGSPASTNPLLLKFFGFPLWLWLVIAAAIVLGVLGTLYLTGLMARGKLVECGECGQLIPEDATVCPKCGAEFESDLVRCSRCSSTIPADSAVCPECAAQLLGKPGEAADPERQGYEDFTERFRAQAKKELGDNFTEGAFWDWWKRQPTYVSFSQWKMQQGQASRAGMGAPPTGPQVAPSAATSRTPPSGGMAVSMPGSPPISRGAPPPAARVAPAPMGAEAVPSAAGPAVPPGAGGYKACPNCNNQIPAEYLVCPFCGSVTQ